MIYLLLTYYVYAFELLIGYEPADLTVHPPPPKTIEGGLILFE